MTGAKKKILLVSSGFSIVEVIIAVGLMGILSLAIMSMISGQMKQTKIIELKLARDEIQMLIQSALKTSLTCTNQLLVANYSTFGTLASRSPDGAAIVQPGVVDLSAATTDETNPASAKIYLNKVLLGPLATSLIGAEVGKNLNSSALVKVSEISVGEFVRTSPTDDKSFIASLVIHLNSVNEGFGAIHPIRLRLNIETDAAAINSRSVRSCVFGGGSGLSELEQKVLNEEVEFNNFFEWGHANCVDQRVNEGQTFHCPDQKFIGGGMNYSEGPNYGIWSCCDVVRFAPGYTSSTVFEIGKRNCTDHVMGEGGDWSCPAGKFWAGGRQYAEWDNSQVYRCCDLFTYKSGYSPAGDRIKRIIETSFAVAEGAIFTCGDSPIGGGRTYAEYANNAGVQCSIMNR